MSKLTEAHQTIAKMEAKIAELVAASQASLELVGIVTSERDVLRQVCAEAYQMAGAIDAPNEALDNLSAAANGDPIPHKTFLPIFGDHLAAHDAEVIDRMVVAVGEAFAYPNTLNPKTKSAEYYKSGWRNAFIFCKQYAAQLRIKTK